MHLSLAGKVHAGRKGVLLTAAGLVVWSLFFVFDRMGWHLLRSSASLRSRNGYQHPRRTKRLRRYWETWSRVGDHLESVLLQLSPSRAALLALASCAAGIFYYRSATVNEQRILHSGVIRDTHRMQSKLDVWNRETKKWLLDVPASLSANQAEAGTAPASHALKQ